MTENKQTPRKRLPPHLQRPISPGSAGREVQRQLERLSLNTVCSEALCPNRGECYSHGTATFLLMGPECTRNCSFCAVDQGPKSLPRAEEPAAVAEASLLLDLRHVVVTSVTRDDLEDGGAAHFKRTIDEIRNAFRRGGKTPPSVEVLVPDFQGRESSLEKVFSAGPEIFNHNMETVSSLYPRVRPEADYHRSLQVLRMAKEKGLTTKSGIMLGLGESDEEVRILLSDLIENGCQIVTIGQYLSPSPRHLPVERYVSEEEFAGWEETARETGFERVFSGVFVRSSYMAESLLKQEA